MAKPIKTKGTCSCDHCKGAPRLMGRHPADPTGEMFGDHHWPLPMAHECTNRSSPAPRATPEASRVERAPSETAKSARPPHGTTTGRVWAIADRIAAAGGQRTQIITACVNAGINESTAATQYSKWKKANA